jgi:hypothetical protein
MHVAVLLQISNHWGVLPDPLIKADPAIAAPARYRIAVDEDAHDRTLIASVRAASQAFRSAKW